MLGCVYSSSNNESLAEEGVAGSRPPSRASSQPANDSRPQEGMYRFHAMWEFIRNLQIALRILRILRLAHNLGILRLRKFPDCVEHIYTRTKNIFKKLTKSRDAAVKKNRYKRSRDK